MEPDNAPTPPPPASAPAPEPAPAAPEPAPAPTPPPSNSGADTGILATLQNAVSSLQDQVEKLTSAKDSKPVRRPWTHWGN